MLIQVSSVVLLLAIAELACSLCYRETRPLWSDWAASFTDARPYVVADPELGFTINPGYVGTERTFHPS